jgi:predicted NUDIX family phosphoesterase
MSKKEHILAVRNHNELTEGFSVPPEELSLSDIFEAQDLMIGSRLWLEEDEAFKQLIPYSVVTSGGKVLAYARTEKGGEGRLSGKVSIGLGGHVNVSDLHHQNGVINIARTIRAAVHRELEEEITLPLDVDNPFDIKFEGFIYDSSNAVGRVHLGLLMQCTLHPDLNAVKHKITSEDEGIHILGFFDPEYLLNSDEFELENWSRIVLEGGK